MPRGDGTGPLGLGPMTGRAAGYCAGYPVPGFLNLGVCGFGRGMGRGRGFRRMYYLTGLPGWARYGYGFPVQYYGANVPYGQAYDEKEALKEQEEFLETQLKQVKERLKKFDVEE